jgi:hypothetical protein
MKIRIIALLFALLTAGYSPAHASVPRQAPPRRLPTGAIVNITPSWSAGGDNLLTVDNGQDLDAVVDLRNDTSGISVYIRSHDSFAIGPVWHDTYSLSFMLGEDWDSKAMTFISQTRRDRFDQPLVFERNVVPAYDIANGFAGNLLIQYTYWNAYLGSANPNDPKKLQEFNATRLFLLPPFEEDN